MEIVPKKQALPTLAELHYDVNVAFKNDQLNLLLNQPTPEKWIKHHPFVKIEQIDEKGNKHKISLPYLPIDKVRFLLKRIFQNTKTEVLRESQLFNAVYVTARLHYRDPTTGEWLFQDGVGAVDIQTKAGASPADLSSIVTSAVQKALPAAKSYAIKNAAEEIGAIFGGDLGKQEIVNFIPGYARQEPSDKERERAELLMEKCESKDELLALRNQIASKYPDMVELIDKKMEGLKS